MSYPNHAPFSLTLGMLAILAAPSAQATTVINGSLFDVSYDETQFLKQWRIRAQRERRELFTGIPVDRDGDHVAQQFRKL